MPSLQQIELELAAGQAFDWSFQCQFIKFERVLEACEFALDDSSFIEAKTGLQVRGSNGETFRRLRLQNGADAQTVTFLFGDGEVTDGRIFGELETVITNDDSNPVVISGKVTGPNSDAVITGPKAQKNVYQAVSVPSGVVTAIGSGSVGSTIVTEIIVQNMSSGPIRIGNGLMTTVNKTGLTIPAGGTGSLAGNDGLYCIHTQGVAADISVVRIYWEDA